jgi:putative tricarboxylic transport membrane protein
MQMNRIAGLFVLCFGLLMILVIIPRHTEIVDYGWTRPHTVPNVMAWVMMLAAAWLVFRPAGKVETGNPVEEDRPADLARAGRAAYYFVLTVAGFWLIARFGFAPVSPLLALAVMLMAGERRPFWLAVGGAAVPFTIWLIVAVLLERNLP